MKLQYVSLGEQAYRRILLGMAAGDYAPMQPLVIRSLAENYGISPTPVREALQRLVAERVLVVLANRSIVVPELTRERFLELLRIRRALEGLAAELAAERIEPAGINALQGLLARIEVTTRTGDSRAYLALNREFHFTIYAAAGSPELLHMIQGLWVKVGPVFTRLFDDAYFQCHANDEHMGIVEALRRSDSVAAREFMVRDLGIAAEALLPGLAEVDA